MRHGWDWSGFGFGTGRRGAFMRGRRRRWFEAGDMKYVILKLLRDKPRHGYEVMKQLEDRFEGYSPSPGTVYPTLQWLEDEGLVAAQDVAGKKVYGITDAGRAFLDEHRDVVEDIFERVRDAVDQALGGAMGEVNDAVGRLMKTAYRTAWRSRDDAVRRKVADALRRAVAEIEGLVA
jgi:DNA-binding PadR family transcriptional regulator